MDEREVWVAGEKASRHLAHKDLNADFCKILNLKERKIKSPAANVPHVIINYLM